MEGKIVIKDEFKIVGVGWTGPYSAAHVIPNLWRDFTNRVYEIKNKINHNVFVSPCHDRPTDFTCYIGVEVHDFEQVPSGMISLTIPTQKYAHFTFKGPMVNVTDFYVQCFAWLKQEGFEKNHAVHGLELYDQRYHPANDDPARETNEYEILIPIK
jgi:AraC family transcriptional regulator